MRNVFLFSQSDDLVLGYSFDGVKKLGKELYVVSMIDDLLKVASV